MVSNINIDLKHIYEEHVRSERARSAKGEKSSFAFVRMETPRLSQKDKHEQEEMQRKEFEKDVLSHHEASTRSCSSASYRTNGVKKMIDHSIYVLQDEIEMKKEEVAQQIDEFNDSMIEIQKRKEQEEEEAQAFGIRV